MSLRSLPLLLLAVLVLGGIYYWAEQQGRRTTPRSFLPGSHRCSRMLPGPPDFLQTWNEDGTKEYHYKSTAKGWSLSYPVDDEASMARVGNLLESLASAKKQLVSSRDEITPKMLEGDRARDSTGQDRRRRRRRVRTDDSARG